MLLDVNPEGAEGSERMRIVKFDYLRFHIIIILL